MLAVAMLSQEMFIDGLAAFKSFFGSMPEADAGFAEFPAETDFAALIKTEKIDEADVEILDEGAGFFGFGEGVFEGGGARIAAGTEGEDGATVDAGSAGDADFREGLVEFVVGFGVFGFVMHGEVKKTVDFGKKEFGVGEGKVLGHSLSIIFS